MQLIKTIEVANELGEGIVWDSQQQLILWVDIVGYKFFAYDPISDQMQFWTTPERLASFTTTQEPGKFIAAFESGFAFYSPSKDSVDWIKKIETDNPGTRFNDGRSDRQGRFWAGTMVENSDQATSSGAMYCLHSDLSVTTGITQLEIPNSLCWSPDGSIVYHADSPKQTIKKYHYDHANGEFLNEEIFARTEPDCYPDGSIVDQQGFVWNAQWGGSKVVRYKPNGEVDLELAIPTAQPSCVGFAGADLDLLVVTSAWQGMDEQTKSSDPQAGHLFIYQTPFAGIIDAGFIQN